MQAIDRFMQKIVPVTESGCWLWTGAIKSNGYGNFLLDGQVTGAHRASVKLHGHPLPAEAIVLHKCDTPSCVNPAHLVVGTQQENVRDMLDKGRGRPNPSKGEQNPRALLTEADVRAIRATPVSITTAALSRAYGVSYWAIRDARKGYSWK